MDRICPFCGDATRCWATCAQFRAMQQRRDEPSATSGTRSGRMFRAVGVHRG
jgi:hypothetical protein